MNHAVHHPDPTPAQMRLVIAASTAGTIFEWYDFFVYGTLAAVIGKTFFPAGNATLQTLLVWATFAVGFGFRPIGAILFGWFGDRLGRKYTFLVTVTLMGLATAGVGLVPSAASAGIAAPLIVIALRVMQGLALGGEYGGAAIYVAEHSRPDRRGAHTGFIQSSALAGFVLSVVVVLLCKQAMSSDAFAAWGWRVPFLLSFVLLAISLWMRLKLSESPVFKAMKEEGEVSGNPFVESLTYPGNPKRLLVAMLGCAAGMTVLYYTSAFYILSFLKGPLRVADTPAEAMVGLGSFLAMLVYQPIGAWSDRIGRKAPMILGYVLGLLLLFPTFHFVANAANPALAAASMRAPVEVAGPDCDYAVFASEQKTNCARLLSDLGAVGVAYTLKPAPALSLAAGGQPVALDGWPWADKAARGKALAAALGNAGYSLAKVTPPLASMALIVASVAFLAVVVGLTYGGMAALLTEMFPARIRYSSMSIPYHFGTGYFGGFLPFIATGIVAKTGDPYSGLWYTWGVVLVALVVALWGVRGGPPRDFADDAA